MIAPKNAVTREVLEKYNTGVEVSMPNLVEIQLNSYEQFLQINKLKRGEPLERIGLEEVFREVFPIESGRGNLVLDYHSYQLEFESVKHKEDECLELGASYAVPLKVRISLYNKETGELRERELYLGDIPLMTSRGTFIINGAERVVVSQIHRSPGIVFEEDIGNRGKESLMARLIPYRGSWLEFEIDKRKKTIWVKIDKNSKVLVTLFLRALGYDTRKKILEAFYPHNEKVSLTKTDKASVEGRVLAEDVVITREDGSVYQKNAGEKLVLADIDDFLAHGVTSVVLISGINTSVAADKLLILCFEQERVKYQKEGENEPNMATVCSVISEALKMSDRYEAERVQQEVNDMFFNPKRYDLGRVGRFKLNQKFNYKVDASTLIPSDIINAIKFLINVYKGEERVDDIDHLGNRRIRAVGELVAIEFKKAMSRMAKNARDKLAMKERKSDVKLQDLFTIKPILSAVKEFFGSSQLCQFMDQVNPLAALTHKRRINALGPGGLSRERAGFDVRDVHYSHYGRVCPIESPEGPNIGLIMSLTNYSRVNPYGFLETPYRKVEKGRVTDKIEYFTATEEDFYCIAQSDAPLNSDGTFTQKYVPARRKGDYITSPIEQVQYMDTSPKQIVSVSTSLIPFLEHDDANRALMGSNMQRQAVPLLYPEQPRVGTGMEARAAYDSGVMVSAVREGTVTDMSAAHIEITPKTQLRPDDKDVYPLVKYKRTNQDTCFMHKASVEIGQRVKAGEVIADGPSTKGGELALGRNVLVGLLPWNGYNFEDAIVVSERLIKNDMFTSIHLKEFKLEVHDTRQGLETITNDIPNAPERMLRKLDENGIVRIGSKVQANDILVGKITPKMESEIEPEKRLITQVFGEKGQEVRDTSLRLPHGVEGTAIDVRRINRKDGSNFSVGIEEEIRVLIAAKRRLKEGDKMAGRHGNKGVIARIVPEEDMPFMEDGTRLDICLSPLGIPSRMNIGQLLETELGWVATKLNKWFSTPVFQSIPADKIKEELKNSGLPEDSKVQLYDGKTGEKLMNPVMVGYMYMLKLNHLVDEKMHARCTGSYSLVTQQPLGGKAQFGGQRLGEMEVWALEAYGAAHTLNEFITVKSDDLQGRLKIYESIVKGRNYTDTGVPESFRVLMHEIRGLGMDISVYDPKGKHIALTERDRELIKKREENF